MNNSEIKRHGRTITISLIAALFGGIAIMWSWNTLAVEMFAQPEMEFRHAVAGAMLLVATGLLLGLSLRVWAPQRG